VLCLKADEGLNYLLNNAVQIDLLVLDSSMPTPDLWSKTDTGDDKFTGCTLLFKAKERVEDTSLFTFVLTNINRIDVDQRLRDVMMLDPELFEVVSKGSTKAANFLRKVRDKIGMP
jgi:hypothetical protein